MRKASANQCEKEHRASHDVRVKRNYKKIIAGIRSTEISSRRYTVKLKTCRCS
jgi:hypothetical protein